MPELGLNLGLDSLSSIRLVVAPVITGPLTYTFGRDTLAGVAQNLTDRTGGDITGAVVGLTLGTRTVGSDHFATQNDQIVTTAVPTDPTYTWTGCTAENSAGSSATFTLTITTAADSYSVGSISEFTAAVADGDGSETFLPIREYVIPSPLAGALDNLTASQDVAIASYDASEAFSLSGDPTLKTVSFSIASGALPSGLSISSAGLITGTPTVAGSGAVIVRGTAQAGTADASLSYSVSETQIAPSFGSTPVISGTFNVGQTLTVDDGSPAGTPAPFVTYEWLKLGGPIDGATSNSYVADPKDDGKNISVRLTASNGIGSPAVITSDPIIITYAAPSTVGSISTQNATENSAFSLDVTSAYSGDNISYTLDPTSDALPAGLSLSLAGVLSGTPTEVVTRTIVIEGRNSGGAVTQSFSLDVASSATVPDQVTGVTAVAGDSQVSVSWAAPQANGSTITDYVIQRQENGGAFVTLGDGVGTGTTYLDTGLTNGTQYGYTVAAVNGIGTGTASTVANATPNSVGGAAPTITGSLPDVVTTAGQAMTPVNVLSIASGATGATLIAPSSLPSGLSFDTGTGVLSGTPSSNDACFVSVRATNASGSSNLYGFTLEILASPQATMIENPTLSYNVDTHSELNIADAFINKCKSGTPWSAQRSGGQSELIFETLLTLGGTINSDGYPASIPTDVTEFNTFFAWGDRQAGPYLADDYVLKWDVLSGDGGTFRTTVPGWSLTGTRRIEFTYSGSGNFSIFFDPSTGFPTNLRLCRASEEDLMDQGAVFSPRFLSIHKNTRCLRFLDWLHTNNSEWENWSERTPVSYYTYTPTTNNIQVPVEVMCDLCNTLLCDAWFTIPHLFTDAAITSFATLVRDRLDPTLKAKYEWSNEVWNFGFQQNAYAAAQATADGWSTATAVGWQVKRATEMSQIIDTVYSGVESQRVRVLGGFNEITFQTQQMLRAADWFSEEPAADTPANQTNANFDEFAITTYFGASSEVINAALVTAINDSGTNEYEYFWNLLLDSDVETSVPSVLNLIDGHLTVLSNESSTLRLSLYEGGQHVHFQSGITPDADDFLIDFVRSDYMADLYQRIWDGLEARSVGPFMQFVDIGPSSIFGSWGLRQNPGDTGSRRIAYLEAKNRQSTQWWTDSRTAGTFTGGVGVVRDLRIHADTHSIWSNNQVLETVSPWLHRMQLAEPDLDFFMGGFFIVQGTNYSAPPGVGQHVYNGTKGTTYHNGGTETWPAFDAAGITDYIVTPFNFDESTAAQDVFVTNFSARITAVAANTTTTPRFWMYRPWDDYDYYRNVANGGSGVAFPGTSQDFINWRNQTRTGMATFYDGCLSRLQAAFPGETIAQIDVNEMIKRVLKNTALEPLRAPDLFNDGAPHGVDIMYLLAAMIVHSTIYNRPAPIDFDTTGATLTNLFTDNIEDIRDYIWAEVSNAAQTTPVSDTTAPTLSSATDAANGETAATGSVDTNEANGTLYWVVTTSATSPSVSEIQAGQDHAGAAAAASGSQTVSATGTQNIAPTGLTASTAYFIHYQQQDAAGNDSTVVTADGFTTVTPDTTAPTLSSAVDAANGTTDSTGSVSTDEGNGTLYWVVTTSATAPSVAQIQAGQDNSGVAAAASGSQAVSATGTQNITPAGLSSGTAYTTHYQHEDAAGNDSTVVSASGFTTGSVDTTAPTLSSATDAANGAQDSTGSVSTDEGNGTLYWVVTTSATAPSVAQIQAGQDNSGVAAAASGSQAVSATGAQAIAPSGLTAATAYTTHYQHQDAAGNDSTVVSASGFTTGAASFDPTTIAAYWEVGDATGSAVDSLTPAATSGGVVGTLENVGTDSDDFTAFADARRGTLDASGFIDTTAGSTTAGQSYRIEVAPPATDDVYVLMMGWQPPAASIGANARRMFSVRGTGASDHDAFQPGQYSIESASGGTAFNIVSNGSTIDTYTPAAGWESAPHVFELVVPNNGAGTVDLLVDGVSVASGTASGAISSSPTSVSMGFLGQPAETGGSPGAEGSPGGDLYAVAVALNPTTQTRSDMRSRISALL